MLLLCFEQLCQTWIQMIKTYFNLWNMNKSDVMIPNVLQLWFLKTLLDFIFEIVSTHDISFSICWDQAITWISKEVNYLTQWIRDWPFQEWSLYPYKDDKCFYCKYIVQPKNMYKNITPVMVSYRIFTWRKSVHILQACVLTFTQQLESAWSENSAKYT